MGFLVACKNKEDLIKNEGARVVTTLLINISDAQGQLTPKSVMESCRNSLQKADHGSQPTPSTSSSDIVHVQPVVEEHDDVFSETIINSLVAHQTHLVGNQAYGAHPTNNTITPANDNLGKDQAQPSSQDPQIHIPTATGKSGYHTLMCATLFLILLKKNLL